MRRGLKMMFTGILFSLLGWTIVNKFVVEMSIGSYIIIELIVLGLQFFYILAARGINRDLTGNTEAEKSQGDPIP